MFKRIKNIEDLTDSQLLNYKKECSVELNRLYIVSSINTNRSKISHFIRLVEGLYAECKRVDIEQAKRPKL